MGRILILGGTRNLGHVTALALLKAGHDVTVLNRGLTPDELPADVERLHASRGDVATVHALTAGRSWDAVVDTTSYTGHDAASLSDLFGNCCGRIVFISTGQVYLVRNGLHAPFSEADYDGPVIPEPPLGTSDHDNWVYGVEKRAAEDVLQSTAGGGVPVVSLRLPMIASERDHYGRIQGYVARMQDGGPILLPDDRGLPIRHVYVEDVARIITMFCDEVWTGFKALNISCGSSISLQHFLEMLSDEVGLPVNTVAVNRQVLEERQLLPACSPYSGRWMSELDNTLSIQTLPESFSYTEPAEYIRQVASDFESRWKPNGLPIPGYDRRIEELDLVKKWR